MARVSRVVLNRAKLNEVQMAFGEGLEEVGRTIIESANPPDAAPYGVGLVTQGGVLVYAFGRKVAGWSQDGRQPPKPRGWRPRRGVEAVIGFGFPGRFQELGTVRHAAQPFLMPAASRVTSGGTIAGIMGPVVRAALSRIP